MWGRNEFGNFYLDRESPQARVASEESERIRYSAETDRHCRRQRSLNIHQPVWNDHTYLVSQVIITQLEIHTSVMHFNGAPSDMEGKINYQANA